MRNLFLKIFLWFWMASILIIVSTLVLMSVIEPYRPVREDGRRVKRLAREGQRAVEILERDGPDALHNFIARKERRPGRKVYLLNEESETVTMRQVAPEAKKLAARARGSGVTEFRKLEKSFLMARPIYGSEGKAYIIVGEIPRHKRGSPVWRFLNPRFLSVRLLAIFIIASIFCYWLAWYLTSPVRTLRTAAQHFASGDLKTRVGPDLGGRRDELADLGNDFDLMAERIESLIASQGRLLRDISHELRSPLARLNVALELARQRLGGEAGDSLDRIEREAERLNELIGQLRTLTILESGAEDIEKEEIDLSRLVNMVAVDADFEAQNRGRSVKTELNENILIKGSEELLHRAIENVVRNAVRYTAEGTNVEISLDHQQISGNDCAVLSVRDHGAGVPEKSLESLFQPFYRVADARDRQSGGMGIGLAITDRAVRLHGGEVKALNAPDGGLVIQMFFPAA
jgi:two-component system sensor histidine kinase CpxA